MKTEIIDKGLWQDLSDIAGSEISKRLMEEFGGTKVYVPMTANKAHRAGKRLIEILGSLSERVLREFGRLIIYIPLPSGAALLAERNAEIIAMHAAGSTTREIVCAHRVSNRWVKKIIQESRVAA